MLFGVVNARILYCCMILTYLISKYGMFLYLGHSHGLLVKQGWQTLVSGLLVYGQKLSPAGHG